LAGAGVSDVLVAYGFRCNCPDDQLYKHVSMSLENLRLFIAEAESLGYYRTGKDNLHVEDDTGRTEFLLCHESDIHFISDDKSLVDRLNAMWLAAGYFKMFEHLDTEWRAAGAGGHSGPAEPEDRSGSLSIPG
jgi:hypothetical protein